MVNGPWGGYSNGNIPLPAMTLVNYPGVVYWSWSGDPADGAVGGVYLEPGCAKALVAMLDRYHQQKGGYLPVNEGYRSYAGQVYWAHNGTGTTPGTSNHGWGKAVDFDQSRFTQDQYAWVLANCADFGFEKLGGPFGQFDYIHFNYSGTYTPPTPPADIPLEGDMKVIRNSANGSIGLIGEYYVGEFSGSDTAGVDAAVAVFGPVIGLTTTQYATAVSRATSRMNAR